MSLPIVLGATLTLPVWHFQIPLEVVILGAITGTTYALFGMGLTLVYQSSRVLNFAQGAMGTLPHLLVASLVIDHGYPYWVALLVALVAAAGSGFLLELGIVRRLSGAPRLVVLVATLGAAQLLLIPVQFMLNLSRTKMSRTPYPVPVHASLKIGNLTLGSGQILILVVAPLLVLALTLFLRRSAVGVASRATAENAESAQLVGVPIRFVSLTVWTISGLLAGSAAILAGPTQPIISTVLSGGSISSNGDLLLRGLGAAMIGGLASLPQVFAAGIGLGVVEALVRWNYPSGGAVDLVVAAIIVASLLARRDLRSRLRGGEESSWSLSGAVRPLPDRIRNLPRVRWLRRSVLLAGLSLLLLAPVGASAGQTVLYSAIVIYILIGLSMVVLTGWAGQVSLGHFSFVALGAMIGGRMEQLGYPTWSGLVIAVAASVGVAVVVGLPALRIRGLFLAVTTLAFAVAVDSWLTQQSWLVHAGLADTSQRLLRPTWAGISFENEKSYYYLVLVPVLLVAMLLVHRLGRTGLARRIGAVRDNEPMAASLSVPPSVTKLLAFVVSGGLASLAGYLLGLLLVNFSEARLTDPLLSQQMVIMIVLGGATSITGAVLGAVYIRGIPYFFHSQTAQLLTSGIGVLGVLLFIPGGLASAVFRLRDRIVAALVPASPGPDGANQRAVDLAAVRLAPRDNPTVQATGGPALAVRDIGVRFGGLTALDGVTIEAHPGEIVGLIGPNGAGKTTLFDVLSGHVSPLSGQVFLQGMDVTHLPPAERARIGLARTFQQARLFEDMTVMDAFKVALERSEPSETVASLLSLPPSWAAERHKDQKAAELVELLGLGPVAHQRASELSTGTRRICELGCAIALDAQVMLLDEPTSGIAQREVEMFTPLLRQVRDHLDATMIVVAHDVPMIVGLVDRVYVLAGGKVIAEDLPDRLHSNPAVVAAYLGTDERAFGGSRGAAGPEGAARRNGRTAARKAREQAEVAGSR